MTTEEFLLSLMPTEEMVDRFVDPTVYIDDQIKNNRGRTFHPELGFIVKDTILNDAMHEGKSKVTFQSNGARSQVNFPDQTPRISSFGNSFTMCNQVNDGESWQEYLGANIGEPIANYGIGGYSVFQAYLRLLREEKNNPSELIIFNTWEDDHYRNLCAWKSIRQGGIPGMGNGFAMPHLRVDLSNDVVSEHPNPTPGSEDVYRFLDPAWVVGTFNRADNLPLQVAVDWFSSGRGPLKGQPEVGTGFGETAESVDIIESLETLTRSALASSRYVVKKVIEHANATGRNLLFVLSYGERYTLNGLNGKPRWDREFVDFMSGIGHPVVDICQAHIDDFEMFSCTPEEYLKRFFIGHYNPVGNHFMAMSLKNQLVACCDPKPPSYSHKSDTLGR